MSEQQIITQYIQIPIEQWESILFELREIKDLMKMNMVPKSAIRKTIKQFAKVINTHFITVHKWKRDGVLKTKALNRNINITEISEDNGVCHIHYIDLETS